jgi:DNA-binding response OmpR family regulator
MSKPGGLRVLLVGCTDAVIRAVEQSGHRTAAHANANASLSEARDTGLDVVILDLGLAGADPFALAKSLRAASRWRKPMFLALGDNDSDELDGSCREAGIDLLLVKPVEPEHVAGFLTRLQTVVEDQESFDPAI